MFCGLGFSSERGGQGGEEIKSSQLGPERMLHTARHLSLTPKRWPSRDRRGNLASGAERP